MLLKNARILTMDDSFTDIERGWIRIDADQIMAMGAGDPDASHDDDIYDMDGDLIMPGMVNNHTHLPMSLFRGLGEDVDDRLFRYILPLERALVSPDLVTIGTSLSALELIMGGVTTVADMYYFEEQIGEVLDLAGLRGVLGQTLANFDAPDHKSMDEAFDRLDQLYWRFEHHPRLTASPAPHAPYSTGIDVLSRVAAWNERKNLPVQLHLAETEDEVKWAQDTYQMSTVELTDKTGLLNQNLVAAHLVYPTHSDIDLLAQRGVHGAYNARSNGKAGRPIAPIKTMREKGMAIGLATDGPMSGNMLDLFSQMAPAVMNQNMAHQTRSALLCAEAILMCTLEAAKTLGMAEKIGSLEVGKQADLIVISLKEPRQQPIYDIYSTLVFATLPCDVRSTMVAGKWLMKERSLVTIEPQKVMADVHQMAEQFKLKIKQIDDSKSAANG